MKLSVDGFPRDSLHRDYEYVLMFTDHLPLPKEPEICFGPLMKTTMRL